MTERVISQTKDYILTVNVTVTPRDEEIVTIRRYIEGIGWAKMELYLTDDEYELFVAAIAEHSAANIGNRR